MIYLKLIILLVASLNAFVHHKAIRRDVDNHEKSKNAHFTPAKRIEHLHPDGCSPHGSCLPPVQCPIHVKSRLKKCGLSGGRQGVCCSTGQNHTGLSNNRRHHLESKTDHSLLAEIHKVTQKELSKMRSRDIKLLELKRPPVLAAGTASFGHFRSKRVYGVADLSEVMDVASKAMEIALATKALKDRQGLRSDEIEWDGMLEDFSTGPFAPSCPPQLLCHPEAPFRSLDGSCNNMRFARWGKSMSPFARLLPPKYQDGIWSPRVSEFDGEPLASPRLISTTVFDDEDFPNLDYTLMLMQFGQFVSHDLTHSLDFTFPNGSAISCCGEKDSYILPPQHQHHACMPIPIPRDDSFFSAYDVRCMNFVRSLLAPRYDCTFGYTQQMNKVTHFLDASSVYGSTKEQVGKLRSFEGGQLKIFNDFGRELLPLAEDKESCLTMEQGSACFDSGDARTNQMITLVAIHTVFMREHNRVARIHQELNPHWSDERLFLEARKILTAEMQVIVYKEFLPCLLGELTMEEFNLNLAPDDMYSYDYDEKVEPSITNEFATAAFRFGHSIVNGILTVYGKAKIQEMINIPEVMFHPARMRKTEFYDEILHTLTSEPIQQVDASVSEALTKYMFRAGNPFGVDLVSLNIQRGRDHGLRTYNHYRVLVDLPPMQSFEEFGPKMGPKLASVYAAIDDIDLWVGGLVEPKEPGSILGATFRDIIADQFSRLKRGDRFFFENEPRTNPEFFTIDQLRELKKVSMSRLICDNSDKILLAHQAYNAFRKPGIPGNEYRSCDSDDIPSINFMFWKEF